MLPQYGGPDDILMLVRYLKPKPTGSSVSEARKALGGSAVDHRKLESAPVLGDHPAGRRPNDANHRWAGNRPR